MAAYDDDVGFRFKPADQELINFFLYRKVVLRQPLVPRHVGFVHEIDLLGDHQPWEIWDACGSRTAQPYGKEVYFFCKLKKLSKSGVRIDRRNASGGFWNGKQLSEDFFVHHDVNLNNKRIIGRKRQFKYVKLSMKGRSIITIGTWKLTLLLAFLMMINRWWRFADLERITTRETVYTPKEIGESVAEKKDIEEESADN